MVLKPIILPFLLLLFLSKTFAQEKAIVAGVVNDKNYDPVVKAKVYTRSGDIAYTDTLGSFYLTMKNAKDSLFVQYDKILSRGYAVPENKVISITLNLYLNEQNFTEKETLPDVTVVNKSHYLDSLENRSEYAKIFNAPTSGEYLLRYLTNPFNLGNLFNGLKFKRNKKRQFYKDFAISLEQNSYVNKVFSKAFVTKYTGLTGEERDKFMEEYAPSYEQALMMDEINMAQYTLNALKKYQTKKNK